MKLGRRNDNVDKNNHVFAKDCVDFVLYIRLQVSTYVDCNSNNTVLYNRSSFTATSIILILEIQGIFISITVKVT